MNFPKSRITAWEDLKASYQDSRAALIPVLHEIQELSGCLGRKEMEWAAEFFGIAPIEVQSTASFYWMFHTEEQGRFRIAVCKNISCDLRGKDEVLRAITEITGLEADGHGVGISADGLFSLQLVECMGACSSAPMMDINGDYHEHLDYEKTKTILTAIQQKGGDA